MSNIDYNKYIVPEFPYSFNECMSNYINNLQCNRHCCTHVVSRHIHTSCAGFIAEFWQEAVLRDAGCSTHEQTSVLCIGTSTPRGHVSFPGF